MPIHLFIYSIGLSSPPRGSVLYGVARRPFAPSFAAGIRRERSLVVARSSCATFRRFAVPTSATDRARASNLPGILPIDAREGEPYCSRGTRRECTARTRNPNRTKRGTCPRYEYFSRRPATDCIATPRKPRSFVSSRLENYRVSARNTLRTSKGIVLSSLGKSTFESFRSRSSLRGGPPRYSSLLDDENGRFSFPLYRFGS